MPMCAMCERQVDRWLPHPQRDQRSPLMVLLETVGSDLEHYLCPHCQCNDRERHVWTYMAATGLLAEAAGRPVLHIAPEPNIERRLRALCGDRYLAGDLFPRDPRHARIDVEHIDQPDGKFHLVICNHVLEHVRDPHQAVRELARVLSDDGWLVAQTPYSPRLRDTLEFTSPPSAEAARLFFGQDDHLRLFGANFASYFTAAGLHGELYPHSAVMPEIDPQTCGANAREPFFLFSRQRSLEARTPIKAAA